MANHKESKDTINDALSKNEAFLVKYRKPISIVIIAIILIIVGIMCYNNYVSSPREVKASTALAKGQDYFAAQQFDVALSGDSIGYKGFLGVISDYGSTKAGNLAKLYAGICYANLDKWDDAIKYLDDFSTSDDMLISPASMAALGNAYAHVKKYDKAVECLKKAAKMADSKAEDNTNNSLSPVFLLQAGEILESEGKKADALEIYKDIKEKYINSRIHQEIDKYIERASI
ncbi:MAG: tetratricopeptide repeat protein [Prevotella sp.]|nr:tetratricopeptide repeat protein [Prevotella sp.]